MLFAEDCPFQCRAAFPFCGSLVSLQDILGHLALPLTWTAWERFVRQARCIFALPLSLGTYIAYAAAAESSFGPNWRQHAVDSFDFSPLWQPLLRALAFAWPPCNHDHRQALEATLPLVPPFSFNGWQSLYFYVTRRLPSALPRLSTHEVARLVWAFYGERAAVQIHSVSLELRDLVCQSLRRLQPSPPQLPLVRAGRQIRLRSSLRTALARVAAALRAALQSPPDGVPSVFLGRLRACLRSLERIHARLPPAHRVVASSLRNLQPRRRVPWLAPPWAFDSVTSTAVAKMVLLSGCSLLSVKLLVCVFFFVCRFCWFCFYPRGLAPTARVVLQHVDRVTLLHGLSWIFMNFRHIVSEHFVFNF